MTNPQPTTTDENSPVDFAEDVLDQLAEGSATFDDFWGDDPAEREAYETLLKTLDGAGRSDLANSLNEYHI